MRLPLIVRPAAQREFDEAVEWYEGQKPGCGKLFVEHLQTAFENVRNSPLVHQAVTAKSAGPRFTDFLTAFTTKFIRTASGSFPGSTIGATPPSGKAVAKAMPEGSPKQPWWRRWFGSRSERAAERFLKGKKHRILVRNWTCPQGELDLVTRDGNTLVFVEVRSTEAGTTELPALSVDPVKQHRLTQLALAFMKRYGVLDVNARFDVVTLAWPRRAKVPRIDYYPNAFPAVGQLQMFS